MIELLALTIALLIGILLGLIGGGGSVLTVPLLVYLMGISASNAITYSLFIVGSSALIGSILYLRNGLVDYKTGVALALPSMFAVYCMRALVLPMIPYVIGYVNDVPIYKDIVLLILFALLLIVSGIYMIYNDKQVTLVAVDQAAKPVNYYLIVAEGLTVGLLTGLVGTGGGFLIVPALVLFARLPMKIAVGTSLLIIAINSVTGFLSDLMTGAVIDWIFLLPFSACAFAGIFLGTYLAQRTNGGKLKPLFGWFEVVVGVFIILREIF